MPNQQVRITREAMDELAKRAKPFESPSDCLKRVLSTNPCSTKESEEVKDQKIESESQQDE